MNVAHTNGMHGGLS